MNISDPTIRFQGIIPAITSPCDAKDNLDEKAFCRMAGALLNEGVHGLYVCGLTGEGYQMTLTERRRAAELAIQAAAGKSQIIVHTGTQAARTACGLAEHAAESKADAVASIPPIGRPFDEIKRYYQDLAKAAAGLPVFIYHIPSYTKWDPTAAQLAALAEIEGVKGIKFTDYNLLFMAEICAFRRDFCMLYGRDEQLAAGIALGAHGGVGSTYNVFPKSYLEIFRLVKEGRTEEAMAIQRLIIEAFLVMDGFGLSAGVELLLREAGLVRGTRRRPCVPLDGTAAKDLLARLRPVLRRFPEAARTSFLQEVVEAD